MSCPSSVMRPALGVSNPASILRSVVLPQPEPPSSAKISPREIVNETSRTASNVPNRLETPSIPRNGTSSTISRRP